MNENLFLYSNRKTIVKLLIRKIIKHSNSNIKQIDILVAEFIQLEIRRFFDINKNQYEMIKVKNLIKEAELILEDILKINITNQNIPISQCNFIVTIIFTFII